MLPALFFQCDVSLFLQPATVKMSPRVFCLLE